MIFFKNFKKNKKKNKNFKQSIKDEIFRCDQMIFNIEKEIHNLKQASFDLIHSIFYVPQKFFYDEYNNIEKIKSLKENQNLEKQTVNDTLNILSEYYKKINELIIQRDYCTEQKNQLKHIIRQQEILKQKILNETEKRKNTIDKHKEHLKNIKRNNDAEYQISLHEKINFYKEEIEKFQKELNLQQETTKQLNILINKYLSVEDSKKDTLINEIIKLKKNNRGKTTGSETKD